MSSGHGVKRKLALSGQSEQEGTGTGMMIQGANPETFKMVEDLRFQSIRASQDETRMAMLLSGVVHDALDSLSYDADGMQTTTKEDKRTMTSADNMRGELDRVMSITQAQEDQMHWLRAESRAFTELEDKMQLARSAVPWLRSLPEGISPCIACAMRSSGCSAATCRIVDGHEDGLNAEDALVVKELSAAFKRYAEELKERMRAEMGLDDEGEMLRKSLRDQDIASILPRRTLIQKPLDPSERIASSMAWVRDALPDDGPAFIEPAAASELPEADLELDWVHTYGGQLCRSNVKVLHDGRLLYTSGGVCVLHDTVKNEQSHFTGHDDMVNCISVHPHSVGNVAASGQIGDTPKVCLWHTKDPSKPLLTLSVDPVKEARGRDANAFPRVRKLGAQGQVSGVTFSRSGRQLVVACEGGLVLYEAAGPMTEHPWSDVVEVASYAQDMSGLVCCSFSPFSDTVVTCGSSHVGFWHVSWHVGGGQREAEGLSERGGDFGCERGDDTYSSLCFLDSDTTLTGSVSGCIYVWKGARAVRVVASAHAGAVLDLASDGMSVVSGGGDGKACLWNFAGDFYAAPAGSVDRGEMLVREYDMGKEAMRAASESPGLAWLGDAVLAKERVGSVRSVAWRSHRMVCGTSAGYLITVDDRIGDADSRRSTGGGVTKVVAAGGQGGGGGMVAVCLHPTLPWIVTGGAAGVVLVQDYARRRVIAARDVDLVRPRRPGIDDEYDFDEEGDGEGEGEGEGKGEGGKKKKTWRIDVTCLDVSQDGKLVSVGQSDGGFSVLELGYDDERVLRLKDKYSVQPRVPGIRPVSAIRFAPNGMWLAVGTGDGIVRIYAVVNLDMTHPRVENESNFGGVRIQMRGGITHIDWDLLGNYIRCNDSGNALRTFTALSGKPLAVVRGEDRQTASPTKLIGGVAPAPPPEWKGHVLREFKQTVQFSCPLSWGTAGLYLSLYQEGDLLRTSRAESCPQIGVPHEMIAAGDVFGTVSLWRFPCVSEEPLGRRYCCHGSPVDHVMFNRDASLLFTGGGEGQTLYQWRVVKARPSEADDGGSSAQDQPKIEEAVDGEAAAGSISVQRGEHGWVGDADLSEFLERRRAGKRARKGGAGAGIGDGDALQRGLAWRETAVAPPKLSGGRSAWGICDGAEMLEEITLERVYGLSSGDGRSLLGSIASGEVLLAAGRVCLMEGQDGQQRHMTAHANAITCLSIHMGGNIVVTGDEGGEAIVWDARAGEGSHVLARLGSVSETAEGFVTGVCFASAGDVIVAARGTRGILRVYTWQKANGASTVSIASGEVGGEGGVLGMCAQVDGGDLVTCGMGGVAFWSIPPLTRDMGWGGANVKGGGRIDCGGGSAGGAFRRWAEESGQAVGMGKDSFELGRVLCASPAVSCCPLGHDGGFLTGMVDGRVLVWQDRMLLSAVRAHEGPVWDLDVPCVRNTWRCELTIGLGGGRKARLGVVARGAGGEESRAALVDAAIESWVDQCCREGLSSGRTWKEGEREARSMLDKGTVHAKWLPCDPRGFVSGAGDGIVMWGTSQVLTVGYEAHEISSIFRMRSVGCRKGHKYRPASLSLQEYLFTLEDIRMCVVPGDALPEHPTVTRNEAARIFGSVAGSEGEDGMDSKGRELYIEEAGFAECLDRIVRLCELKRMSDSSRYGALDRLEERCVDLKQKLAAMEAADAESPPEKGRRGRHADGIVDVRNEIRRIQERLAICDVMITVTVSAGDRHRVGGCVRGLLHTEGGGKGGMLLAATSENCLVRVDADSGAQSILLRGHEPPKRGAGGAPGAGISAICAHPSEQAVATGGGDGVIVVWDVSQGGAGELRRSRLGGGVTGLAWCPTGGRIIAGLKTSSIILLDASALTPMCSLDVSRSAYPTCVSFAPISPLSAGGRIAVGLSSGRVKVYEIEVIGDDKSSRLFQVVGFPGHAGSVSHVDWSEDATAVRSDSEGPGEACFWRVQSGKKIPPEKAAVVAWEQHTCTLAWHMVGMHVWAEREDKVMGLNAAAVAGSRVVLAADREGETGTLLRVAVDGRADVRWDSGVVRGDVVPRGGGEDSVNDDKCTLYIHELVLAGGGAGGGLTAVSARGVRDDNGLIASGDESGRVTLSGFPCLTEPVRVRCTPGHAGPVSGLTFIDSASRTGAIASVGAGDSCILLWRRKAVGARPEIGLVKALLHAFIDATCTPVHLFSLLRGVVLDVCGASGKEFLLELEELLDVLQKGGGGNASLNFGNKWGGEGRGSEATVREWGRESPTKHPKAPKERQGPGECPVCKQTPEDPPSPRKAVGKIAAVPSGVMLPGYQWIRDKTEGAGEDGAKDEGEAGRPKAGEGGAVKGIWSRLVRYSKKWLLTTLPREAKGQGGNNLQLIETNKETRDQRRLRERNAAREIQAKRMFARLDLDMDGQITHSEFIRGLAANPDIANLLGLPSKIRQEDGSRELYQRVFGDIDQDNDKALTLEEFVTYYTRRGPGHGPRGPRLMTPFIKDSHVEVESRPPPQEKRLFATSSLQHNTSILPSPPANPTEGAIEAGKDGGGGGEGAGGEALDIEEAVALYMDLCGGSAEGNNHENNDGLEGVGGASAGVGRGGGGGGGGGGGILTHDRLSTALRGHPRVMQRLSGRKISLEEFVFFFTGKMPPPKASKDMFSVVTYVEKTHEMRWNRPVMPAVAARGLFEQLDEAGRGKLSHAQMIKSLRKFPKIAEKLGFPAIIRQHDGSQRIYQLIFGAIDYDDTRVLTVDAFVKFFAEPLVRDTWRDGWRLKLPSTESDYRISKDEATLIFQKFDQDGTGMIDVNEFLKGLRDYPSSAEKLRLPSQVRPDDDSRKAVDHVFDQMDTESTGIVLEDEFIRYFTTPERLRDASSRARKKIKMPKLLTWDRNMVGTGEGGSKSKEEAKSLKREVKTAEAQTDPAMNGGGRPDSDGSEEEDGNGREPGGGGCWYCGLGVSVEGKKRSGMSGVGRPVVGNKLGVQSGSVGRVAGGRTGRGKGEGVRERERLARLELLERDRRDAVDGVLFEQTMAVACRLASTFVHVLKQAAGQGRAQMSRREESSCLECMARLSYLCLYRGRVRRWHFKRISEVCLAAHGEAVEATDEKKEGGM